MRTQSNTLRPFNAIHFSWSFSCSSLQQEIREFKHSWYLFMFFVIYMVLALIARQWCLSDIVWDKICLKLEAPNDEDCILGRCLELYRCYIHQNRSTTFHRHINSIFIKKLHHYFQRVTLPVPLTTQVQMQVLDWPEICLVRLADLFGNTEEAFLCRFPS